MLIFLRATLAFVFVACAGAALPADAQTSPAPVPASASPVAPAGSAAPDVLATPALEPDPKLTLRAKEWLRRFETGDIDRTQLDPEMNHALTGPVVAKTAAQLKPLGEPTDFTYLYQQKGPAGIGYSYQVTFKDGTLVWFFAVDSSGKITGLRLRALQ